MLQLLTFVMVACMFVPFVVSNVPVVVGFVKGLLGKVGL